MIIDILYMNVKLKCINCADKYLIRLLTLIKKHKKHAKELEQRKIQKIPIN